MGGHRFYEQSIPFLSLYPPVVGDRGSAVQMRVTRAFIVDSRKRERPPRTPEPSLGQDPIYRQ